MSPQRPIHRRTTKTASISCPPTGRSVVSLRTGTSSGPFPRSSAVRVVIALKTVVLYSSGNVEALTRSAKERPA